MIARRRVRFRDKRRCGRPGGFVFLRVLVLVVFADEDDTTDDTKRRSAEWWEEIALGARELRQFQRHICYQKRMLARGCRECEEYRQYSAQAQLENENGIKTGNR